jgi:hypothetical protein
VPSIVFPRIQPVGHQHCQAIISKGYEPPVVQCEYIPFLQYSQVAHEQIHEIRTCSPFLNPLTELPISSIMPTPSCPNIVPGVQVATSPLLICRSVPQIVDFVSLMIASVGWLSLGFGRSSSLISPTAR